MNGLVNADTARRVLKAAEALGYRPNPMVPHHQVGVEAARMLLESFEEDDRPSRSVLLPLSLVVRGSTTRPPHDVS